MKQGLTGSAANEMDVLSWEFEARKKAIMKRDELDLLEKKLQKKVVKENDCIKTYYFKKENKTK